MEENADLHDDPSPWMESLIRLWQDSSSTASSIDHMKMKTTFFSLLFLFTRLELLQVYSCPDSITCLTSTHAPACGKHGMERGSTGATGRNLGGGGRQLGGGCGKHGVAGGSSGATEGSPDQLGRGQQLRVMTKWNHRQLQLVSACLPGSKESTCSSYSCLTRKVKEVVKCEVMLLGPTRVGRYGWA
ncbi:hypothetical protein SAY87_001983 [Trapa incisa]|uniref:Uncharacterized protein n=1 Tax=Trapa incisa TaxID=236973 RepID=A0AAN7JTG3_9MYRT|nr:hypothetical protein SAY87_001983 [Trapa incisa]